MPGPLTKSSFHTLRTVAVASALCLPSFAQNLLPDGGFELGLVPACDQGLMPSTWFPLGHSPDTYSFDCSPGHEGLSPGYGNNYILLPAAHSGVRFASGWHLPGLYVEAFGTVPTTPILPGHLYRISVWLAGPNNHTANGHYIVRLTNTPGPVYAGVVVAEPGKALAVPTASWIHASAEFIAPLTDEFGQPVAAWSAVTMVPEGVDVYIATDDWELVELSPATYCTAGSSANGCQAMISASGVASATAPSGFLLEAMTVEGQKDGLFFFGGNGSQASSWGNGTSFQCVVPPVTRAGLLPGTGTTGVCDGSFSQDLNALWSAFPQKNPGAGALLRAQLWYRDPFNTSNQTTSLSDAIEVPVGP